MAKFIEVHWTCGSMDEARKVSRYLVQERLVACAQIIPWIESIFLWDNKLDVQQESKVVLKTRAENYERIKNVILKNTIYEVPEITIIEIAGGNKEYLDWIAENTPEDFSTATIEKE